MLGKRIPYHLIYMPNRMKCVVINLERARERREKIARHFQGMKIQFEFFTGIDGHEVV